MREKMRANGVERHLCAHGYSPEVHALLDGVLNLAAESVSCMVNPTPGQVEVFAERQMDPDHARVLALLLLAAADKADGHE